MRSVVTGRLPLTPLVAAVVILEPIALRRRRTGARTGPEVGPDVRMKRRTKAEQRRPVTNQHLELPTYLGLLPLG